MSLRSLFRPSTTLTFTCKQLAVPKSHSSSLTSVALIHPNVRVISRPAPRIASVHDNLQNLRTASTMASATTFYEFTPKDKKGAEYPLSQHKGKVILAVNTASKCGFTPQYKGLETLYQKIISNEKYKDQFVILGFPCNQFGGQDPGSNDEIQNFCQVNYGVSFPVLGKTDVNGDAAEPVFEWMKSEKTSLGLKRIKWNFEKFLIGKDGKVVSRWASTKTPESLEGDILKELAKPESKA